MAVEFINGEPKEGQWWGEPIMLRDKNGVYYHSTAHEYFGVAEDRRFYYLDDDGCWCHIPFDLNKVRAKIEPSLVSTGYPPRGDGNWSTDRLEAFNG